MPAQASPPRNINQFAPVTFLATAAKRYIGVRGLVAPDINYRHVILDPMLGRSISDAYMRAPLWDERALAAYRAFRSETIQQFRFLVGKVERGGLGVDAEAVDHDPYEDAQTMAEDLRQRRLKIFSSAVSDNPHPFLSDRENDMFRAVHDAFGHAATGCGFDQDGEEGAWLKQYFMYSSLARRALATETRGQSCAQFFHFEGKQFPRQKLMLLPSMLTRPAVATLSCQSIVLRHGPIRRIFSI